MELRFESRNPLDVSADALIVPLGEGVDGPVWPTFMKSIASEMYEEFGGLVTDARFRGKTGKTITIPTLGHLSAKRAILTGIGDLDHLCQDSLARAAGAAVRAAMDAGAREIALALPDTDWGMEAASALETLAIGVALGGYRFDGYRGTASPASEARQIIDTVWFVNEELTEEVARPALHRAAAISRGVTLARDLGNEPASTLTPEVFADRARTVAGECGLEIEVLGQGELAEIGATATLAVGAGSSHSPRLIRLSFRPESDVSSGKVIGLVGKAITFDTGGYSIKPYEGMLSMKGDMAGGAAVLGAMAALRELKCQSAVEATICAAENMISGTAFRPGDVLRGMNGVTIEILSTDAEGRLVLADGLVDTARRGATELIDLATLTGAAVVALGDGTTALFANDDRLADGLLAAAAVAGERMWRMPLTEELEQKIEGDIADIKNTGGRAGGAITAALFLRHFSEGLPWAHLDIAGSARQEKASSLGPKGATGVGVRTLLHYVMGT